MGLGLVSDDDVEKGGGGVRRNERVFQGSQGDRNSWKMKMVMEHENLAKSSDM